MLTYDEENSAKIYMFQDLPDIPSLWLGLNYVSYKVGLSLRRLICMTKNIEIALCRGFGSWPGAIRNFLTSSHQNLLSEAQPLIVLFHRASSGYGPDRSVSFRNGTIDKNLNHGQDHSSKYRSS